MSESSTEELRLRATEAHCADSRAARLTKNGPPHVQPTPTLTGMHRSVTVVQRDHDDAGGGTNRFDAARQTLGEQVALRDQADHRLQEAQTARHPPDLAHLGDGHLQQPRRLSDTTTFIQSSTDALHLERHPQHPEQHPARWRAGIEGLLVQVEMDVAGSLPAQQTDQVWQ